MRGVAILENSGCLVFTSNLSLRVGIVGRVEGGEWEAGGHVSRR